MVDAERRAAAAARLVGDRGEAKSVRRKGVGEDSSIEAELGSRVLIRPLTCLGPPKDERGLRNSLVLAKDWRFVIRMLPIDCRDTSVARAGLCCAG